MTASGEQRKIQSERRIIERPRLIKLLDESEARTILLLAPAGYGKTTLARQWAKTLNGAIWISLTAGHRDVARLAEDIAAGIDALGGEAGRFIGEYVRSRRVPQSAARDLAAALAEHLKASRVQWLVLDDYHELRGAPEAEDLLASLQDRVDSRWLVTARIRPSWATARRNLYGDVLEIDRTHLAMDEDEAKLVLGRRTDLLGLASMAEGWPAVLGLASGITNGHPPANVMPNELYDYVAEELYESAPARVQKALLKLALAPELNDEAVAEWVGGRSVNILESIRDLGFLSSEQDAQIHPLIRDFLLEKLGAEQGAAALATEAVWTCVKRAKWDRAFELVLRFELSHLIEPVLEAAYSPLVRSGHLGTISAFVTTIKTGRTFPPPAVELVEAEVALRDGSAGLARSVASRVLRRLPADHSLTAKASKIVAQACFDDGDVPATVAAYEIARAAARDDRDEADALYGWALASIQGELGETKEVIARLGERRHNSPLDLIRFGTVELVRRKYQEGYREPLNVDEYLHVLGRAEDPRARTSLRYMVTYALAVRGQYEQALVMAHACKAEVDAFDLDFARPHSDWNLGCINLGLRRFGLVERSLQLIEDAIDQRPLGFHVLNARVLRMRLALETGELDRAATLVRALDEESAIPSIHAEHRATQGLCLAVLGHEQQALTAAGNAESATAAIEVRVLAQAARAVIGATHGDPQPAIRLFQLADQLGAWDPVIVALRASNSLNELMVSIEDERVRLEDLYRRSNDVALARRAGFRIRSQRRPDAILSPRESEVLELLARGFRNREIAKALVISDSTTKVHVRHILEKMGVRTRTEAVARYEMFATEKYAGSSLDEA